MISFDEFLKQDDEEKYNNAQMDIFEIQALKDELKNRDIYISKLGVAYSKEIERLNSKVEELMTLYTTEREVKEDYKSIIKEVREYITRKDICIDTRKTDGSMDYVDLEQELLEILDKEKV